MSSYRIHQKMTWFLGSKYLFVVRKNRKASLTTFWRGKVHLGTYLIDHHHHSCIILFLCNSSDGHL